MEYLNRVQRFAEEEKICLKQNYRYTWLRLALIVFAVVFGITLFSVSAWLGVGVAAAFLLLFAVVLKKHLQNIEKQQQKERLKIINQQEINCLSGDFSAYSSGSQYANTKHFYSSDLDIFGEHSLFRFINRTTSPSGSDMLADWLSKPATTAEIRARQQAVKELAPMLDLRQEMQVIGLKHKKNTNELPEFLNWLDSNAELSNNRKQLIIRYIFPWISVSVLIAAIIGWLPPVIEWIFIITQFAIYSLTLNKINRLHQQVSRKIEFISVYSELFRIIVGKEYSSPELVAIRNCFVENGALQQIVALQKRMNKLDYRLNMAYVPINILFFFDYKNLVWLERWRERERHNLRKWFEALAKAEALSSFANMLHNNPDWAIPEICDDYFYFEGKDMGHPLIIEKERICNDFSLKGAGQIAIITGSNMSGKSTFERSIGVNMALALAGAPVCASKFRITNCQLYTYMRIADNLEEQTSSFYAELKRLKQLLDITKDDKRVFFLLDEVLRGTNSNDRQIGSMALLRQLVKQRVSGIIATHDLALGQLEHELPNNINNAHFDVQIDNDNMSFDYKLYQGICTSLNASILMKTIGIIID